MKKETMPEEKEKDSTFFWIAVIIAIVLAVIWGYYLGSSYLKCDEVSVAPGQVDIIDLGSGRCRVSWTPVDGSGGYILYWNNSATVTDKVYLGTATTQDTQYEIDGLTSGKIYYFTMQTKGMCGNSALSSVRAKELS